MLKVYPASRFFRAPMWIEMKNSIQFKHFLTARWLHHYEMGTQESPHNSKIFWPENIEDIQHADIVMCYAESNDDLGGALVEVGVGITLGKIICVVGENDAYRSWIYHPQVQTFPDMISATNYLDNLNDIEYGKRLI